MARRRLLVPPGQQRPDGAAQVRDGQARQPAQPVRRHAGVPDHEEPAVRVRQLRPHAATEGTQNYARDLFLPSELALPRLTRGNDTAAEPGLDPVASSTGIPKDATPNDPRSTRTYATMSGFRWPDEDYSGRLDWQLGQDSIVAPLPVHAPDPRDRRHHPRRADARQNNKQQNLGITWTQGLPQQPGRASSATASALRNTNVDIAAGNDTPIVRFTALAGVGHDPRQRGALPDPPRPDRSPVRLQPVVDARHGATR